MKQSIFIITKMLLLSIILSTFNFTTIYAQDVTDICKDGDCSPDVFNIKLDYPLAFDASANNNQRTEDFKKAYAEMKKLEAGYMLTPGWKTKYDGSQLGGKSCLRHYHINSLLAQEYEQNPDFKKFIENNESDVQAFREKGFDESGKEANLLHRMKKGCPEEVKKHDKQDNNTTEDASKIYMTLGRALGYFDKDGNLLKPIPTKKTNTPAANNTGQKKSKKEQVADLQNQLNQLPLGQPMKDKVNNLSNSVTNALPKVNALKNLLGGLTPRLSSLLPKSNGILSKLGGLNNLLSGLKGFSPNIPNPNLLSKIGNLFNKGQDLAKRAKDVVDKSNKLKNKFDNIVKDVNKVKDDIGKSNTNINKLKDALDNLQKEKANVATRFENRPKKYIEEIRALVNDLDKKSKDLVKQVSDEDKIKDKLLEKLAKLTTEKDDVVDQLKKLEDLADTIMKEYDDLKKDTDATNLEVEAIKAKEKVLNALKDKINELKPEQELKDKLDLCDEDVQKLLNKITPLKNLQTKLKDKSDKVKGFSNKIMARLDKAKAWQNKLKIGKNGIPVVAKTLNKIDGLLAKGTAISGVVQGLTGKQTAIGAKLTDIDNKINSVQNKYTSLLNNQDALKKELVKLIEEKTGIKAKLNNATDRIEPVENLVNDFISRYNAFDAKLDCPDQSEIEQELKEIEEDQEEVDAEIDDVEEDFQEIEIEQDLIEEETKKVEEEIEENTKRVEELKAEEAKIQEEFGQEMTLETVPIKEWTESFEVKRPYWEATFHPDDEVVEGYKGRYFEVKLKDADKDMKLLFKPGKYYMDKKDFRDKYGSTIGAFVTEALSSMKNEDKYKVKLFVQGSADITGSSTFRGNMDSKYLYNNISVLPLDDDKDGFSGYPKTLTVPERSFRNSDLPNLRGQYLIEMISIYSKKLKPVLLEGTVTDKVNADDRNAVIYLFIPDEFAETYGD